jgi:hypothetical protein
MGDGRRFEVWLQGNALLVKPRGSAGDRAPRPR